MAKFAVSHRVKSPVKVSEVEADTAEQAICMVVEEAGEEEGSEVSVLQAVEVPEEAPAEPPTEPPPGEQPAAA